MARIVVLGAGISGHTAVMHLRRMLNKRQHQVIVVSPNSQWNWIPSNIWVGAGIMDAKKVVFPLAPIYRRLGAIYHQAKATTIFPEGTSEKASPQVEIEYTDPTRAGQVTRLDYDFLINCTGPKLNFNATPGLGPDGGHTVSVCTADHAKHAATQLDQIIAALKKGQNKRLVIGTGAGTCTCQGAAFEYTFNVEHQLREAGVRDLAEVVYLTNEAELGDFGVGGMKFKQQGFYTSSKTWTESLFRERNVLAITGAAVKTIQANTLKYERLDGSEQDLDFDFAMLLPPFSGQPLKAFNREGEDITPQLFAPSGFMKVDADYTPKPYEDWQASDWPHTYQSPAYDNIFAAGIAFAPPHQISKPRTTPNGTAIAPAPPRTGMPSGTIGREVAKSIVARIKDPKAPLRRKSMADMGAACVASTGKGILRGSAAAMVMHPIVPDTQRFPITGRHPSHTMGEMGLFGHWVKFMLHYLFIYKAKAKPFWFLIPE